MVASHLLPSHILTCQLNRTGSGSYLNGRSKVRLCIFPATTLQFLCLGQLEVTEELSGFDGVNKVMQLIMGRFCMCSPVFEMIPPLERYFFPNDKRAALTLDKPGNLLESSLESSSQPLQDWQQVHLAQHHICLVPHSPQQGPQYWHRVSLLPLTSHLHSVHCPHTQTL